MFWNRKKTDGPAIIAQALFDKIVCEVSLHERIGIAVKSDLLTNFQNKVRLYQYAAVLTALLHHERTNQKFLKIRVPFEALFFPTSRLSPIAQSLLKDVQKAMDELVKLSLPIEESKPFTWTRTWLAGVGIEEYDVVKLTLFVTEWQDLLLRAMDTIQDFEPMI